MHTFEHDGGVVINHNGDYSGDVIITDLNGNRCEVPFEALRDFVAGWVRADLINFAENAPSDVILRHAITQVPG